MIKANELRLGNLLSLCGVVYSVNEIQNQLQYIELKRKSDENEKLHEYEECDFDCEDLTPVEITENELLCCGFILTGDFGDQRHYEHPSLRNFSVVFVHEEIALHHVYGDSYVCVFYDDKIFQYMHQLQNLFFSLVGEELVFSTEP